MRVLFFCFMVVLLSACDGATPVPPATKETNKLIYFDQGPYSPYQGMLATVLDVLDGRSERFAFKQVDVVENKNLSRQHDIKVVPTLLVVNAQGKTTRITGRVDYAQLTQFFNRAFAPATQNTLQF